MRPGPAGRDLRGAASPAPPPFARVAPSLFLGSARAAASPALLARAGVTLCVNVSRRQPGPAAPGVAELRVPVFDDPAEDLLAHLEPTCAAMEAAVRAGGACLVYCKNGRSRSAAVCTAYLMRHRGLSLARAFQLVKSARPVAEPNPGFWSQLQQYEATLQSLPRPSPSGSPQDRAPEPEMSPRVSPRPSPLGEDPALSRAHGAGVFIFCFFRTVFLSPWTDCRSVSPEGTGSIPSLVRFTREALVRKIKTT